MHTTRLCFVGSVISILSILPSCSGADASPTVTLGPAGSYTGTVVASNVAGSSPSFDFPFVVADVTASKYVSQTVDATGRIGSDNSITDYGGRLAGSYWDLDKGDLHV